MEWRVYGGPLSRLCRLWASGWSWRGCRELGTVAPAPACRDVSERGELAEPQITGKAASENPSNLDLGGIGSGGGRPPKGKEGRKTRASANR